MNASGNFSTPGFNHACVKSGDVCMEIHWEVLLYFLNAVEVIANILHLIVLSKLEKTKGLNYLRLLQAVSLSDIGNGLCAALNVLCPLRKHLCGSSLVYIQTHTGIVAGFLFWRNNVLATASVDRALALTRPFQYASSLLSRHRLGVLAALPVISLASGVVQALLNDICVDPVLGATLQAPKSFWATVFAQFAIGIPLIVITTSSIASLRVLYKMRRRALDAQQEEVNRGARYVILCSGIFIATLVPLFVIGLVQHADNNVAAPVKAVGLATYGLYGILNTILYGWSNGTYRKTLVNMFSKFNTKQCAATVYPGNSQPESEL